jgi:hypothetical protein
VTGTVPHQLPNKQKKPPGRYSERLFHATAGDRFRRWQPIPETGKGFTTNLALPNAVQGIATVTFLEQHIALRELLGMAKKASKKKARKSRR